VEERSQCLHDSLDRTRGPCRETGTVDTVRNRVGGGQQTKANEAGPSMCMDGGSNHTDKTYSQRCVKVSNVFKDHRPPPPPPAGKKKKKPTK